MPATETEPANAESRQVGLGQSVDPITFSVILSRFNAIATEMTLTLEHTAWTSLLALSRDYSCAIYDSAYRQIATFDAVPVHTNSMHHLVRLIAETFADEIYEGDVFFCNHPYRANTHVGDLATVCPVFVEGTLRYWCITRGHQQDAGAFLPSSILWCARNVWQEGIHIPPIKIIERGREKRELIDLYLSNVRYPELLHGDLLAQISSIEKGRSRILELAEDYGVGELAKYVDEMIAYASRRMAEELRRIPDGVYVGETWVDTDGAGAFDIPIRVSVTIEDDHIGVDFSGSGPQTPTGVNGTFATSQSAPTIPFMCYIDPDIPHNHGCIGHISIDAPEGSICNARYPAATSLATITPSNAMIDAINKAMAVALPDRVFAGAARTVNMPDFAGVDPRTGESWGTMLFNNTGGGGASKGADGWPLFASGTGMGCLKGLAIEQLELLYPLLVEEMELEPDSMGYGQWIGGPGSRFVIQPRGAPVQCTTFSDGYTNPPHGILGGTPGRGGMQYVEDKETGRRKFYSAMAYFAISTRERWVGVSTGGGGYGRPVDRDVEQVRRDVRDGVISRDKARGIFGVAVSDDFDPMIEHAETARLRAALEQESRAIVDPTVPSAATWAKSMRRPGDEYFANPVSLDW